RNKNRKNPFYYPNKVRNKSSKVAMGRIAMWYFYWLICLLVDLLADLRIRGFAYSRICLFAHSPMRLAGLRAKDVSPLRDGTLRSLLRSYKTRICNIFQSMFRQASPTWKGPSRQGLYSASRRT